MTKKNERPSAMILAAGFGTRMRPLTDEIPKALVPVSGSPLITYSVDLLKRNGFKKIHINTHYLGHMIEDFLGDGSSFGLEIKYSHERKILGTGGGILRARNLFDFESVLVINADTIIDADIEKMLESHYLSGTIATLCVVEAKEPFEYTPLRIDEKGHVKSIGGKPDNKNEDGKTAYYTGLSILSPKLLAYLPETGKPCLFLDAVIPSLMDGMKISSFYHHGYWQGIDSEEKVRETEIDIANGKYKVPDLKGDL